LLGHARFANRGLCCLVGSDIYGWFDGANFWRLFWRLTLGCRCFALAATFRLSLLPTKADKSTDVPNGDQKLHPPNLALQMEQPARPIPRAFMEWRPIVFSSGFAPQTSKHPASDLKPPRQTRGLLLTIHYRKRCESDQVASPPPSALNPRRMEQLNARHFARPISRRIFLLRWTEPKPVASEPGK
jgi:hypothetical protein